jgi:predicted transcriptional regulator
MATGIGLERFLVGAGKLRYVKVTPISNIGDEAMPAIAARTVSVKLSDELRDRIRHLADARQRTTHWVMREAIEQYVEREEKREAFRQATLQMWEEFQMTGLHATLEETDQWLARLEAGQDAEPPECHV